MAEVPHLEKDSWFVKVVWDLVYGRTKSIASRRNPIDVRAIRAVCWDWNEAGHVRVSRRGWQTFDHPALGIVQWKCGGDFRNGSVDYFFFRINGRMTVSCWAEKGSGVSYARWVHPVAQGADSEVKARIELTLGSLQHGTHWPSEQRPLP